jgi:S-formylglutathione hydrolase FrmB
MLANMSVIDPPFLLTLGGVAILVIVAGWRPVRRRWMRFGVRGLGVFMIVLVTAGAINARYEYLPTWTSLFGARAADQVSLARLRQLENPDALDGGRLAKAGDDARGVVVPFPIPGTHSHFHARTAQVYLPPAYFRSPHEALPVIELLHGEPGSPVDWTRGAYVDLTADDYAAQHHGFAPILVMPDTNGGWLHDSECVNGKHEVETYLTKDVRDAVIARFHTRRDAQSWAIAGLSEGGYCALQIGLRNPDLYRTIGDYSGGAGPSVFGGLAKIFAGSPAQIAAQAAHYNPVVLLKHWKPNAAAPAIWFEDGSQDATLKEIALEDGMARHLGFDTRLVLFNGPNHSFGFWGKAFADSLPWMAEQTTAVAHPPKFAAGELRAAG